MRTTVRLNEALLSSLRKEAARRGTTLTALIEQGAKLVLRRPSVPTRRARVTLPVSSAVGGHLPGVDLDSNAAILDLMEGRP